jgi:pimeloyl-ACP methyl ester carboxylesterase
MIKRNNKMLLAFWIFSSVFGILLAQDKSGYAPAGGLKMYYEIHGSSQSRTPVPLVLIHGGGSTIETNFSKILPLLSRNRKIIAVELQAHGHTEDIDRPLSFEQDADDVAALLKYLKIGSADFFGFSNGGNTAMQIAIRHPEIVHKLIIASSFYKRDGIIPQLWEGLKNATLESMPEKYKEAYLKVAPNPDNLKFMFGKDRERMLKFKDWSDEDIKGIKAPSMIMIGDKDIIRPEHAVEMYRLIPNSQLVILPNGHGTYIGELAAEKKGSRIYESAVSIIEEFLDAPVNKS